MLTLILSLFTAVLVDATLTDGQKLQGELVAINDQTATVLVDGAKRDFELNGIEKLAFEKPEQAPAPTGPVGVELTDGTKLTAKAVTTSDAKAIIRGDQSYEGPTSGLRAVRYFAGGGELSKQWTAIVAKKTTEDLLVINRNGNLDYLAGLISGFDDKAIQFEFNNATREIPINKAAGFVLAKPKTPTKTARVQLSTHAGDIWRVSEFAFDGKTLKLTTPSGFQSDVSASQIGQIEFRRTGIVYLTAMEPESMDFTPFVASVVAADDLKTLHLPRADKDFHGEALRIQKDKEQIKFKRGLAMASKSEITYRLASKYTGFQAWAGMDPSSPSVANVELRVFADDNEVLTQEISKSDQPVLVDVPLTNVNRLRIIVDYGKNMDIGDRLHLGDARLTK